TPASGPTTTTSPHSNGTTRSFATATLERTPPRLGLGEPGSVPSARHARAAPESDRVPADHHRRRRAAGDHHRDRRRGATVGFGSWLPVLAELLDRSAHRARTVRLAPVDRVVEPHVHRAGVGGGDRRGARQPRAHPEAPRPHLVVAR